jgi:hypothetical protein
VYADLERFLDALEKLADLRRRGLVDLEASPTTGLNMRFKDEGEQLKPTPGGGLYLDVTDALGAATVGTSLDDFVQHRSSPRPSEGFSEPEEPDVARAKYEAAQGFVAETPLNAELTLAVTSRVPVLSAQDWEIVQREADSAGPPDAQSVRYGIVRLTTEQFSVADFGTESNVTVFTVDARRLDSLIMELRKMQSVLGSDSGKSTSKEKEL